MKWFKLFFLIVLTGVYSCKKQIQTPLRTSSLTIINEALGNSTLASTFTSSIQPFSKFSNPIIYGSSAEFGQLAAITPLTIVSSADTTIAFYQTQLNFKPGGIYSLYLTSQPGAKKADAILMQDTIPYLLDSVAAVRFVNMSTDNKSININLQGNSQNEFSNLTYKNISSFKKYSANSKASAAGGYNFEIRDAATGTLLATFNWNYSLFKSNTLVIGGLENDSTGNYPINVCEVNNY